MAGPPSLLYTPGVSPPSVRVMYTRKTHEQMLSIAAKSHVKHTAIECVSFEGHNTSSNGWSRVHSTDISEDSLSIYSRTKTQCTTHYKAAKSCERWGESYACKIRLPLPKPSWQSRNHEALHLCPEGSMLTAGTFDAALLKHPFPFENAASQQSGRTIDSSPAMPPRQESATRP